MARRQNFSDAQRLSALQQNAIWLKDHSVAGILIDQRYEALRKAALIYYCENCLFCHTSQEFFDVDHLVPDQVFKAWGKHADARDVLNMQVLCKSIREGDLGCNQSKGGKAYVPRHRGLAFSRGPIDMNCFAVDERPMDQCPPR